MRILLWNIQWCTAEHRREFIVRTLRDENPDVTCLTEATDSIRHDLPNLICSGLDYGYVQRGDRRKVWLATQGNWQAIETVEDSTMPPGRFVSGITQGIRFVGICVPWSGAHVTTGKKNRMRWEDHLAFLKALGPILKSYAEYEIPVCVLGDFNQRVPAAPWNKKYLPVLRDALGPDYKLHTEGQVDADGQPLIDHIATTKSLRVQVVRTLGRKTDQGMQISDHPAVIADLTKQ